MNRAVKRQRRILSDASSSSSTESNGSGSRLPSVSATEQVPIAAAQLSTQRSVSTTPSAVSTMLLLSAELRCNGKQLVLKKQQGNRNHADDFSADTAELVQTILRHKPSPSHQQNHQPENVPLREDYIIGTYLKFQRDNTMPSNYYSENLLVDDLLTDKDPQKSDNTLNKEDLGLRLSSTSDVDEISNHVDGESVETAELVRRIQQPLVLDGMVTAGTCKMDNILHTTPILENPYFSTKENTMITSDKAFFAVIIDEHGTVSKTANTIEVDVRKHSNSDDEVVQRDHVEDEFVLPEQSDSSENDSIDSGENGAHFENAGFRTHMQFHPYPERNKNEKWGKVQALSFADTFRMSRSKEIRSAKPNSTIVCASMPYPQPLVGSKFAESEEDAAFGFSPEQNKTGKPESIYPFDVNDQRFNGRHNARNISLPNSVVRYGLSSGRKFFSPGTLQKSEVEGLASNRTGNSGGVNEENIENFSDDEYDQAFGFGRVASSLLVNGKCERVENSSRPNNLANRSATKSIFHNQVAVENRQEEALAHEINVGSANETIDRRGTAYVGWNHPTCQNTGILKDSTNVSYQCGQAVQQISSSIDVRHEVMHRYMVQQRPRRIRNPSIVPEHVSHQPSTLQSLKTFRRNNNNENEVAQEARSSTAQVWERNDVFGGSGVGAGSYQLHKPIGNLKTGDMTMVEVDSNDDRQESVVVPNERRPTSRSKSFKKTNTGGGSKINGKKANRGGGGSRGSGRRGKWGWKKGKQGGKRKGSATGSSQNGNHRTANTWAGNTDDPQLRHVGGAEMSF